MPADCKIWALPSCSKVSNRRNFSPQPPRKRGLALGRQCSTSTGARAGSDISKRLQAPPLLINVNREHGHGARCPRTSPEAVPEGREPCTTSKPQGLRGRDVPWRTLSSEMYTSPQASRIPRICKAWKQTPSTKAASRVAAEAFRGQLACCTGPWPEMSESLQLGPWVSHGVAAGVLQTYYSSFLH